MRNALLAAVAGHIAVVAGIGFDMATQPAYRPQIEVTLATRPTQQAPLDARMIAQADQRGSGEAADPEPLTTSLPPTPAAPGEDTALPPGSGQNTRDDRVLSTSAASRPAQVLDEQNSLTARQRELASLQAQLDAQTRTYTDRSRVRRLTAASAKAAVDAAYLLDWRRRLEAVGNRYYPEASIRYGIYGDLRMLVVVRSDGSLENIEVLSSSGYAVLDEAAIKIVRMAAPFAPFPAELAATTDKLEIIRTWQFRENQLSSGQEAR